MEGINRLNEKEKLSEKEYILNLVEKLDLKRCAECGYNKFYGELTNFYPVYTFELFKGEIKFDYAPEKDPQYLKLTCQHCGHDAGRSRLYGDR